MITIFTTTHRQACLEFSAATADDIAAYDATSGRYFQEMQTTAALCGYTLRLDDAEGGPYSYQADTDTEHQWIQDATPFWEWYQAGIHA